MSASKGVVINVMGREFRVAAPDGEEKQLAASVEYLNKKMKEIRDTGKVNGNERIAIMAALNMAHEFLALSNGRPISSGKSVDESAVKRRMESFENMIDTALAEQEKLF